MCLSPRTVRPQQNFHSRVQLGADDRGEVGALAKAVQVLAQILRIQRQLQLVDVVLFLLFVALKPEE